ncbi:pentapeptide repeat-containing protein [uncultured Nostoc sp.]|uniref:pentapeptide repeat-containing protein n=1 Tax=uncultured Nostoc sp. TaxID=340711 RepID=UPI0035CA7F26
MSVFTRIIEAMLNIEQLRESFARVYEGPDNLQHECDMIKEAEQLNIPLDTYRRLYVFKTDEPVAPYPKSDSWKKIASVWTKWFMSLPLKNKIFLLRKGIFWLLQKGILLSAVFAIGHYIWTIPERHKQALEQKKQAHYQAWLIINSAQQNQTASGGRKEALEDLSKDDVSLEGVNASGLSANNKTYLRFIQLQGANLQYAKLQYTDLTGANFQNTYFFKANFQGSRMPGANFSKADLKNANLTKTDIGLLSLLSKDGNKNLISANFQDANLQDANLQDADLQGANLQDADLIRTDLRGSKNISTEQVKSAKNWQQAYYSPEFRKQLGLP